MTFNEAIEQYLETKEMISKLEKKLIKYKDTLETYLKREGKTRIKSDKFVLESKEIVTHRLSKANVPSDVWEKWSKESSYSILKISKIEGKIRKSL